MLDALFFQPRNALDTHSKLASQLSLHATLIFFPQVLLEPVSGDSLSPEYPSGHPKVRSYFSLLSTSEHTMPRKAGTTTLLLAHIGSKYS